MEAELVKHYPDIAYEEVSVESNINFQDALLRVAGKLCQRKASYIAQKIITNQSRSSKQLAASPHVSNRRVRLSENNIRMSSTGRDELIYGSIIDLQTDVVATRQRKRDKCCKP